MCRKFWSHKVFFPGKYAQTIALNTSRYVLMETRDLYQIDYIGRQLYGTGKAKEFVEVYKNVVLSNTYGYLMCDLPANTPTSLQLRSHSLYWERHPVRKYIYYEWIII